MGILTSLLLFSLISPLITVLVAQEAPDIQGPLADRITIKPYIDETAAALDTSSGIIKAFMWTAAPELIEELSVNPNVQLITAPGFSINQLALNTYVLPFSSYQIRKAIQYIVDREDVVEKLALGYGESILGPFPTWHPDSIAAQSALDELGISYDLSKAESLIMASGIVEKDTEGKLLYKNVTGVPSELIGEPVSFKFLIRSDDPVRHKLGEVVATQLEQFGFTVEKRYGDLEMARRVFYNGDPATGDWHIYTEAWGYGTVVRYCDDIPWLMFASTSVWMPQHTEIVNGDVIKDPMFANSTIDAICDKLIYAEYENFTQRDEWIAEAQKLGVDASVRVFVLNRMEVLAANKDLTGFVIDPAAGVPNRWTMWSLHPVDRAYGGEVTIAHKHLRQDVCNIVYGFNDEYGSQNLEYTVYDPYMWTNPATFKWVPILASWEVEQDPVNGIPFTAKKWNYTTDTWDTVTGTTLSKVTFSFPNNVTFHDGTPLSMDDILYEWRVMWEWDRPGGELQWEYYPGPFIVDGIDWNATEMTLDVYVSYTHLDPDEVAQVISFGSVAPAHLMELVEELVVEGKLAWTEEVSALLGVPQPDLIDKTTNKLVEAKINDRLLNTTGTLTEEMKEKYENLLDFYATYGHFLIGTGPWILESFTEGEEIVLKANRNYYYKPSKWWEYTKIEKLTVVPVSPPTLVDAGESIDLSFKIEIGGAAFEEALVITATYDPLGTVVFEGNATHEGGGIYGVTIPSDTTADWFTGIYTVYVTAKSKAPSAVTTTFLTESFYVRGATEVAIEDLLEALSTSLADLSTDVNTISTDVDALSTDLGTLSGKADSAISAATNASTYAIIAAVMAILAFIVSLYGAFVKK